MQAKFKSYLERGNKSNETGVEEPKESVDKLLESW